MILDFITPPLIMLAVFGAVGGGMTYIIWRSQGRLP